MDRYSKIVENLRLKMDNQEKNAKSWMFTEAINQDVYLWVKKFLQGKKQAGW